MSDRDLDYLDEIKICPHCKTQLSCCEAPQIHVGDGLGWGSDVLFICLNDFCSLFLKGWEHVGEQYGHHASYRYMELPGSKESNVMMVGNKDAFKGSLVDKEAIRNQNKRYKKEKEAVEELKTCVEKRNLSPVLTLLLDESALKGNKASALEYLIKLNDLSCIDALRNHTFRDGTFEQKINMNIKMMLDANFKKECPYCAEIIKSQAKKCMHCKENL